MENSDAIGGDLGGAGVTAGAQPTQGQFGVAVQSPPPHLPVSKT